MHTFPEPVEITVESRGMLSSLHRECHPDDPYAALLQYILGYGINGITHVYIMQKAAEHCKKEVDTFLNRFEIGTQEIMATTYFTVEKIFRRNNNSHNFFLNQEEAFTFMNANQINEQSMPLYVKHK